MITFPPEFVATKYPGYFYNTNTGELYTIKFPGGILRPLKKPKPNYFNHYLKGYKVCVNGHRRVLSDEYLNTLKQNTNATIPVIREQLNIWQP